MRVCLYSGLWKFQRQTTGEENASGSFSGNSAFSGFPATAYLQSLQAAFPNAYPTLFTDPSNANPFLPGTAGLGIGLSSGTHITQTVKSHVIPYDKLCRMKNFPSICKSNRRLLAGQAGRDYGRDVTKHETVQECPYAFVYS